jgi:hypothetical protein
MKSYRRNVNLGKYNPLGRSTVLKTPNKCDVYFVMVNIIGHLYIFHKELLGVAMTIDFTIEE